MGAGGFEAAHMEKLGGGHAQAPPKHPAMHRTLPAQVYDCVSRNDTAGLQVRCRAPVASGRGGAAHTGAVQLWLDDG